MFERYSGPARRAIFFARDEASRLGSTRIETHHILLGLLRESWDVFAPYLKSRDAALAIRDEIETLRPPKPALADAPTDLPFTHEVKRVLAYAAEEAEQMHEASIDPVHLLLGLLREKGSVATEILRRHGLDPEAVRQSEGEPDVLDREVEIEALQAAVLALPANKRDTVWRVLEALGQERVRVEVTSPADSFTISFGEKPEAPAGQG